MIPVPPKSLGTALAHVFAGGRLLIPTYTRATIIEQKHIDKWDAVGKPLLSEDGNGYRMRQGKSSVFLLPGQLKMID